MVSSFLSSPGSTHPGILLTSLAADSLNLYGPLLFILETGPQLALPWSRDLAYKELLRLPSSRALCCLPHRSLGQGLLSSCPSPERKQGSICKAWISFCWRFCLLLPFEASRWPPDSNCCQFLELHECRNLDFWNSQICPSPPPRLNFISLGNRKDGSAVKNSALQRKCIDQ